MARVVTGALILVVASGCAPHADGPRATASSSSVLTIHIENELWFDMDIFVEGGIGAPQLVGIAPAKSIVTFRMKTSLFDTAAEIRLIADPHGSTQRMVSDPMAVGIYSARWYLKAAGSTRLVIM